MTKETKRISVIMPTLNSAKTIKLALDSVKKQIYDHEKIEIIVVDGGSSDSTREIALEYGCKIVENPRIQPECAKHEGILHAGGKYAIFLDSDEVLENKYAFANRIKVFDENSDVRIALMGGYKKPKGASNINDYINTFSDPFSFFMYGISSGKKYYLRSMKKKYKVIRDEKEYAILSFSPNDVLPLVDICAGNMVDLEYLKEKYQKSLCDVNIVPQVFNLLVKENMSAAIMKNDATIHYSSDSFKKYVKKIKWRILINIHYSDKVGVGFSNRENFQPLFFRIKKYLFIPYSLSLLLPLIVSIYFAISRKLFVNLFHFPLTVFTALFILWQYFLKFFKIKPKLKAYGA